MKMDSKDSSGNSSQPMLKEEQETVHRESCRLSTVYFTLNFIIWKFFWISVKESLNRSYDKNLNKTGLSIIMAVFFIVGEMAGTGIVNLPQAISQTGWIGCGFLILCACMASFTGTKLGKNIRSMLWLLEYFFRRMLELYHSKRTTVQRRKLCPVSNNSRESCW